MTNQIKVTDELYDAIKAFLKDRVTYPWPETKENYQKRLRFRKRWGKFYLDGDRILITLSKDNAADAREMEKLKNFFGYRGLIGDQPVTLELVRPSNVAGLLATLFDEANGHRSVDTFYDRIRREYLGVSKRQVQEFVRLQPIHQMLRPAGHTTIRPIVSRRPREQWEIDLIDMRKHEKDKGNKGNIWILVCIDTFSKFAWTRPMKSKKKLETRLNLMDIMFQFGRPAYISSDNGGEFKFMDELMDKPPKMGEPELKDQKDIVALNEKVPKEPTEVFAGVKYIHSAPYNPRAQGQVERFNGTLKNSLYKWMQEHNTEAWLPVLQLCTMTYNLAKHTTTNKIPFVLMFGTDLVANAGLKDIYNEVHEELKARADRMVANDLRRQAEFSIPLAEGDTVRVNVESMKDRRKLGGWRKLKGFTERWSRNLYRVVKIGEQKANESVVQVAYVVGVEDGEPLEDYERKYFYRTQLMKIDPKTHKEVHPEFSLAIPEASDEESDHEEEKKRGPKKGAGGVPKELRDYNNPGNIEVVEAAKKEKRKAAKQAAGALRDSAKGSKKAKT